MEVTRRLVLPSDVALVPVRDLADSVRARFAHRETDYAVSRERGRGTSHIIDAAAATLVDSFRTARSVVDAVIAYGRATNTDPEQTLVDAWPMLRRLVDAGLLVPEGAGLADAIAPTFALGDRVGRWTVVACIQVLADTEVYQVRDETGRYHALKRARLTDELHHAERFEHEAAILDYLGGDGAPRLIAHGTLDGSSYLVTEWCEGVDITRAEVGLPLIRALLGAYAGLHARGVVHGDVHPRNVLVDARGRVRLIDFAYARRLDTDAPAPPRAGVAFYTEPEWAFADTPATALGEQYALGAMIYFLVAGAHYLEFPLERTAFQRAIIDALPLSFAARGAEPWPEMEAVLARALAKAPNARFASIADMIAALPAAAAGVPTRRAERSLLRSLLSDVLARADTAPPYETAPTASVVYGMAGFAFMLYRVALMRDSGALLALADRWAARAAVASLSPSAFNNVEGRLGPEVRGEVSPYHTVSGVYCVQALIANAGGDGESLAQAINGYLVATSAPCASPELLFGNAGVLVGTALLVDALARPHPDLSQRLIESGERVFAEMWQRLDVYPEMPACGVFSRVGAAHGWAGALYASLRWRAATGRPMTSSIAARLDELASYGEPWGRGLRWPHTLDPNSPERREYLSGWCNGTAGLVLLWTLAGRHELADRAAWHVWDNLPDPLASLCCGSAGAAYALLERAWRRRGEIAAERAARTIVRDRAAGDGLWYGEVGVALLAADLESDGAPGMPFFSGEGWPTGVARSSDRS